MLRVRLIVLGRFHLHWSPMGHFAPVRSERERGIILSHEQLGCRICVERR